MKIPRPQLPVWWPQAALALLAALAVVAVSEDALARGGGGGRFNDGGGGGGGGGGLPGVVIELLLWLVFRHPVIGIPLLLVAFGGSALAAKRTKGSYQGLVIRRGLDARMGNRDRFARQRISEHDATFDEAVFLGRVEACFMKVQRSWCAHELGPIRPFVSDGLFERFELQLAEQQLLGYRDRMERLEIEPSLLAEAEVEGPFEVVTVRVRARAADYSVSLESGDFVAGSMDVASFAEYWSFVRRTSAKSGSRKGGLMEGSCPNCGAPITMNQWSHCRHCKAMLRSGEHDWVLTEITQASQWHERDYVRPPGVEKLRRRDADFGLQHLEDRTSLLFWRWRSAFLHGDVQALGRVGTEALTASVEDGIAARRGENGERSYIGECAVGHVTVVGVEVDDAELDHALVEVVWSGTDYTIEADGKRERGRVRPARCTLFVLSRPKQARSGLDDALASAHCSGCGAPEAEGDAAECQYCGAPLTAANAGWTVAEITPALSVSARAWKKRLRIDEHRAGMLSQSGIHHGATTIHKAEVLSWMAQIAAVDGVIAPKERKALEAVAAKTGLKAAEVEKLCRSSSARSAIEGMGPKDPKEARMWLASAARTALADGNVSRPEMNLLEQLARPHGLLPADVRVVVNSVRAVMYKESKVELAARRRG